VDSRPIKGTADEGDSAYAGSRMRDHPGGPDITTHLM
jgi:hypothetical protein